ncbi:ribosomal RNA small subunit methyltransferase A [Candidatus Vecturithrix granuli]|uniref:Ribosomal RNA small subunit methyltransferase A n=1 Tax=Vecturithrix granuli TaxID=1499967 RepID=A0A081BY07_VECG1|nr:ribosomal RNA small subunit methyltransferase A [Candidatus Vecturithrix granuli]
MRKRLGQHFLTDRRIIARILDVAAIQPEDVVVEIGPGKGSLTFPLAERVKHLVAIEYDPFFVDYLQERLLDQEHVQILQADARRLDYVELFLTHRLENRQVKLIANLPYYAAVPILLAILHASQLFQQCTFMFQKEVGERITAVPGQKSYSLLSVTAQYYSKPTYCFTVPAHAFHPSPQVESAVVNMQVFAQPLVQVVNQEHFFRVVKHAFLSRRKTLKNSLITHGQGLFPGDLLHQAFERLHFAPNIRGEELSVENFAALSNELLRLQREERTP